MASDQSTERDLLELNLLRWQEDRPSPGRLAMLALGSLGVHLVFGAVLFSIPEVEHRRVAPLPIVDLRKSIPLVAPRFQEPTQKAPNTGKISRELDVRSAVQSNKSQAPRFKPPAVVPGPSPTPAPAIETPKLDVAMSTPVPAIPNTLPQAPPPDKPKLAFESIAAGSGPKPSPNLNVAMPPAQLSLQEAAKAAIHPTPAGGIVVGDSGDDVSLAGSAQSDGRPKSNLQLLSDPQGVDFKPYLVQVLTAVRRNWLAVIPESAHMGRRGQVLIQFIIDRRGSVPKLVIATPSGTEAFDRAAVAGVSMSNPFPPLPQGYQGDQIRLQLAFSYNSLRVR
jgi:TonB family protein